MARGSSSKQIVFNKILETFDGAFMADEKTLRIPLIEDGEPLEIKVTLTAAKDILGKASNATDEGDFPSAVNRPVTIEHEVHVTEEEKENLRAMMASLGL